MADRIQLRRDTAANWTAYNPILLEGEPGIEIDTDQWKLGDGIHNWNDLGYRGMPCVQQMGQSTTTPMSQKAVTDILIDFVDYLLFDNGVELGGIGSTFHYKVFASIPNATLSKYIGNNIKVTVGGITTNLPNESMVQVCLFNSSGGYSLREVVNANQTRSFVIPPDAVSGELRFYTSVASADTSGYNYSVSNVKVELSGNIDSLADRITELETNSVLKSSIAQTVTENQTDKIPSSDAVYKHTVCLVGNASGIANTTTTIRTGIALKAGSTYKIYFKSDTLISSSGVMKGLWIGDEYGTFATMNQIKFFTPEEIYAGATYVYTPSIDCYLYIRTQEEGISWHTKVYGSILDFSNNVFDKFDDENERIDGVDNKVEALKAEIGTKITFYDDTYSKVGTGGSQPFNTVVSIPDSILSANIGRKLRVTTGEIVSDLGEGFKTCIQICTYNSSGGYIERIAQFANETKFIEITSEIKKIDLRFYTNASGRDTSGYTYSVELEACLDSKLEETDERLTQLESDVEELDEIVSGLSSQNPWNGKNVVVWGDSITAQGNGDNPGTGSFMYWAKQALNFANLYQRGIGGQSYIWNTSGWYTAVGTNGNYLNRYKYDAQGNQLSEVVSPATVTQEEITNIEHKYGKAIEVHYGSFCSWDSIKTMIPESIRTTIDLIVLCGGTNDHGHVEEVEVEGDMSASEPNWVANDQTDPTWAADNTYYKGGDYDITTFSGAIASTIMKMLTWCPNAVVVLATPFPRFNTSTKKQYVNTHGLSFRRLCEIEDTIAHFVSTDVIDANGKCNINGVNFANYQTDGVHPNLDGRKMYGRVFVNELMRIAHKI